MSLILVRHGQTALNVARVLQPEATGLSEQGHAQARALGLRLRGAGLAAILSSDLPRARLTAHAVAAACGLAVETSVLLRERDFGDLRGRPYDSLGFDPLAMTEAPPGGESAADFDRRCTEAWAMLIERRAALAGPLAVITHGLVLRAWLQPGRVDLGSGEVPAVWPNAAVGIVDERPPHRVELMACTAHLGGVVASAAQVLHGG